MSSGQNRPTGRQARVANTGMDDPRSAGAHSAGYQEGYPSETVDYGNSGQGYPSESAQYGRTGQQVYPQETSQYGRATSTQQRPSYETGQYGRQLGRGGEDIAERHRQLRLGGTLAMLTGLLTFFMGMIGILKRLFFANVTQYPFTFNARGRGTTELVIGAVLTLLGLALLLGMHWARHVTVAVAVLAAIFNFMFLPYYPFWSIVLLALDVFIIWSLLHHRGQQQQGQHQW